MGETNQQRWWGVRPTSPEEIFTRYEPPEGCTYVEGSGAGSNVGVTVYTVPADNVLYLTDWLGLQGGTVNGIGWIEIWTDVPAIKRTLARCYSLANASIVINHTHNIALQLDAGDYLWVLTTVATVSMNFWFTGYLRPV